MNSESEKMAVQAFEMSQNSYEEGKYELAQTYMLNAITHSSNLKYLKTYPSILKKLPLSMRNTHIDQAINIYSIALFNNPPEEIVEIMKLIDDLKSMMSELTGDYSTSHLNSGDDSEVLNILSEYEKEFQNFTWTSLVDSGKIEDISRLNERVEFFNNLIQDGTNISLYSLSNSQRHLLNSASQELHDTKIFIEYVSIRKSVEQFLEEARLEIRKTGYNSQYVVCRLQQVNTLLSQLWLFDVVAMIGRESYVRQLNDLQKTYADLERDFLTKESEPLCKKIKSEIELEISKPNEYPDNKLTSLIESLQKRYGEIATQIAEIPLKSKLPEMQEELQKLAVKISNLSKKRYAAYQRRCAEICCDAIRNFESITWVWEKDAEEILKKNPLHTINEALITPETATILQITKQMLEEKLSISNKADFAVKCIEAKKMQLEDF